MSAPSPNARPGRGLTLAAAAFADRLVQRDLGATGAAFSGFEFGRNGADQELGTAFGQIGTRLFRQWWRDTFGERVPPVGSKRWRQRLASLPVPVATRGPCLLLSDDSTLLLEDGGAMRLSGS